MPTRTNLIRFGMFVMAALVAPSELASTGIATAAEQAPQGEPFGRFTIEQLDAKLKEAKAGKLKLYIFDNNSHERYQKSHLPGARWVDYSKLQVSDLPKEKDATLVFYCANEH